MKRLSENTKYKILDNNINVYYKKDITGRIWTNNLGWRIIKRSPIEYDVYMPDGRRFNGARTSIASAKCCIYYQIQKNAGNVVEARKWNWIVDHKEDK